MNNHIRSTIFGYTSKGDTIHIFLLRNQQGMEVSLINYGATVASVNVPDKRGNLSDVVLGFEDMAGYESKHPYFGCVVGRYANRIANGIFNLDGKTYQLATNNGPNHLHGGIEGFNRKVWKIESTFQDETGLGVIFSCVSEDGEEGFPGKLMAKVTYILTPNNELDIAYEATTDKKTIINLTNHLYFNLKDGGKTDIQDHRISINADYYTPVDSTSIPTGEIAPVDGTPFDLRQETVIGKNIDAQHQQISYGSGYDHNFIINPAGSALAFTAKVLEPETGRVMEVFTTEPGVQFYTANFLDGSITGKGISYQKRSGFCLETQHYPDSPNKPHFPSVVLNPGEVFQSITRYAFSTILT